jgi:hypothetical protein
MFKETRQAIDQSGANSREYMYAKFKVKQPENIIDSEKRCLVGLTLLFFACLIGLFLIQNHYKNEAINNPLISEIVSLHQDCGIRSCSEYAVVKTEGITGTLTLSRLDYNTLKVGHSYNFTPEADLLGVGMGTAYYHDPHKRFDNYLSFVYFLLLVVVGISVFFFCLSLKEISKQKERIEKRNKQVRAKYFKEVKEKKR